MRPRFFSELIDRSLVAVLVLVFFFLRWYLCRQRCMLASIEDMLVSLLSLFLSLRQKNRMACYGVMTVVDFTAVRQYS